MTNEPAAVALTGVVKRFGATTAVDGVDLTIAAGRRVAVLGLNGAGKTTTIAMILGLLRPDAGDVRVFDRSPRDAVRSGLVGAMLQSARVPPRATVAETVGLATRLYPGASRPGELLERTGLTDLAKRRVERLSGGELQRVKFAVAVAGRPRLLMLDEPTTAMDVPSRQAFWQQMRAYAAEGHSVVYCTHLMDEARDADEVVVMRAGRIVAHSSPDEITRAIAAVRVSVAAAVPALPGVDRTEARDGRTYLTTNDPDAVVYALAERNLVRDLRIDRADLDSAFLALAGDSPLETVR